jgi:hypothetical protein
MMRLQQLGQTVKRQTLQLSWVTVQYKCCDRNEASVVPIIVAFTPIPDSDSSITVISDDQPVFFRTRTLRNGTEASNQQYARSLSKASHFCVTNNARTTKHRKGAQCRGRPNEDKQWTALPQTSQVLDRAALKDRTSDTEEDNEVDGAMTEILNETPPLANLPQTKSFLSVL